MSRCPMSLKCGIDGLSSAPKRRSKATHHTFLRAKTSTVPISETFLSWVLRSKMRTTPKPSNIAKTSQRNIEPCFPQSTPLSIRPALEGLTLLRKKCSMAQWQIPQRQGTNSVIRTIHHLQFSNTSIRLISQAHRRSRFPLGSRPMDCRSACKLPRRHSANRCCARSAIRMRKRPAGTRGIQAFERNCSRLKLEAGRKSNRKIQLAVNRETVDLKHV